MINILERQFDPTSPPAGGFDWAGRLAKRIKEGSNGL